jgi:hypothetical protein
MKCNLENVAKSKANKQSRDISYTLNSDCRLQTLEQMHHGNLRVSTSIMEA